MDKLPRTVAQEHEDTFGSSRPAEKQADAPSNNERALSDSGEAISQDRPMSREKGRPVTRLNLV